jgi:hypothetical protein
MHKYDVISELNGCVYRKAQSTQRKDFSLSALFSFAGVSAAKEKAVEFAVFAS